MTDRRDNAPPPEGWVFTPDQRAQLLEAFRKGIGSRPADTPEFRARVAAIEEHLIRGEN